MLQQKLGSYSHPGRHKLQLVVRLASSANEDTNEDRYELEKRHAYLASESLSTLDVFTKLIGQDTEKD